MKPSISTIAIVAALAITGLGQATNPAAAQPASKAATFEDITWDALMPKDWDPMKGFRDRNVGLLIDGDPRSEKLLREMREVWDNAPTNNKMNGAAVKLAGYVVPLEEVKGEMKEFLLVPYFGACVHSPPPPANQIIHVVANPPVKGLHTMDPVWASGVLSTQRQNSEMGTSGYRMVAARIEPYVAPVRR